MTPEIVVRPPRSLEEARGVQRVNARCWVEAYDHILPENVLPDPSPDAPAEESLRGRLDYANSLVDADTGRYALAVAPDKCEPTSGTETVEAEAVVGFAAVRWGDEAKTFVGDDDAGLWLLYVDPSRWGEGIGTALLDAVIAEVPERHDRLVLETFAENTAARGFYQASGFEVVEKIETEVGDETYPAVVMARTLDS
ncbi:GNAT family N-acetyltransferase [Haloferax sp. AB510]|uniref:GNAT family N-acetyltransferase n=1 Tax=Haloferax sp. AB510 TaxID=2934172 RepID=UPI00209C08D0|nr:GNAT family N-acetyltransferase [Haloferax sp. AB510]MCO8266500.1 GNAT family N-acetyltransferase [Haloferax sp. AB510]